MQSNESTNDIAHNDSTPQAWGIVSINSDTTRSANETENSQTTRKDAKSVPKCHEDIDKIKFFELKH